MSVPMNNVNKGGYVPPGFSAPAPNAPPADNLQGYGHGGPAYGFQPAEQRYAPLPQHPMQNNGEQFPGGQPPYQQPPAYEGNLIYGGPNALGTFGSGPPYSQVGGQPPHEIFRQPIIVSQPGGAGIPAPGEWMNIPHGIPNCPTGLEYLTTVDQLLVKQKVELLEAFTGFETNNKFTIKNSLGQKVYYAVEDNDCCTRNMCGPMRPFDMKILDNYKNEVIHLYRPLACDSCCFPCCLQTLEVSAPPGNVIGSVVQEWSLCSPQFSIKNHHGDTVLRIEGPFCTFSLCGDVEFKVVTLPGEQVGKISKQWSGLAREMFTDADFFGITFPMDLDVRMKAVLLGATFLIDAMFFEKQGNRESDRPGML